MNFGAENIAACIVEPIAGSTGTLVPPKGYLQRLREICDKHGILLIFDEVITGWGRTGSAFASQEYGVTPDIMAVEDIFEKDDIFNRVKELAPYFQEGLFSLKDIDVVDNIRGYGMMGGVDIKMDKKPGAAGFTCFKHCYEAGVNFKATGDCLIIAPMFICEKKHIDEIIEKLRTGITNYAKSKKN